MQQPTSRQILILKAIVREHIRTGEPVGSKSLCDITRMDLSSATMRSEMGELGQMGYLEQPHTSSGRIPSVLAFRLYIDQTSYQTSLKNSDKSKIDRMIPVSDDPQAILEAACGVLAAITRHTAVITTPCNREAVIRQAQVIPFGGRSGLILLMTSTGQVQSRMFRIDCSITPALLEIFSNVINQHFLGRELSQCGMADVQTIAAAIPEYSLMIMPMLTALASVATEVRNTRLNIDGEDNLLTDFDKDSARELIELFRGGQALVPILRSTDGSIRVIMGGETSQRALRPSSIVAASYNAGGTKGQIGIVGPVRMDYDHIIPRIDYFAQRLGQRIAELLD